MSEYINKVENDQFHSQQQTAITTTAHDGENYQILGVWLLAHLAFPRIQCAVLWCL